MGLFREMIAELFVMAAIGLVLGLLGPFGTYAIPIVIRVATWLALALSGYAFFRPVIAAGIAMHERTATPRTVAIALACVLAAIPLTLAISLIFHWAGMERATPERIADKYPAVLLIGVIATVIQMALFRDRAPAVVPSPSVEPEPPPSPPEPLPTASEPSFLDRLPPAHRALLALEMEDHYVRAHSAAGSTLVLIRMRDAVAELAAVEGMRVHRSWWVARASVAQVVRRDRAVLLHLVNGIDVPVARNATPALRAAGWL